LPVANGELFWKVCTQFDWLRKMAANLPDEGIAYKLACEIIPGLKGNWKMSRLKFLRDVLVYDTSKSSNFDVILRENVSRERE
jgi:hypothetical protein